ncbi:hypothetical protein BH09PSE2_BH09PSE2_02100 [soil metagenome]
MSIGFVGLHQLLPALNALRAAAEPRVLLLGTQDLHFTYDQAVEFFRRHACEFEAVPADQRRTAEGFGFVDDAAWSRHRHFMHHETLFAMLGVGSSQIDVIDVSPFEGANIIHDLNLPLTGHGPYDLLLDQGTLEHLFDVAQVLRTLADLTKVGGEVIHMSPAGFLNHGFYNFNATLFEDFYGQSGWSVRELYYSLSPKSVSVDAQALYGRLDPASLGTIPEAYYLNVFSRHRREPGAATVTPTQGFYRDLHSSSQPRAAAPEAPEPLADQTWADSVLARRAHETAAEGLQRLGAQVLSVQPAPSEPQVEVSTRPLDPKLMQAAEGLTFAVALPDLPAGDANTAPDRSQLVLFEDGAPLGPAHAMHAEIASFGAGRFSHWHDYLFFSTPDGSSPLTNGRAYSVSFPAAWR